MPPPTVQYHDKNLKDSIPDVSVFLLDIPDKLLLSTSMTFARSIVNQALSIIFKRCSP